jgi:hypothetical protein
MASSDGVDAPPVAEPRSPSTSWDFFVSYTAADRAWAEWIAWQLEAVGYRVLFQAWDFVPGSHWTTRMREGITGADRTLAVVSSAYLRSVYGQAEWEATYRRDPTGFARRLVPIRVEECEAPDLLGGVVSLDLFGSSADAARRHLLERVAEALAGRAKPSTEPSFPDQPGAAPAETDQVTPLTTAAPRRPPATKPPAFPGSAQPSFGYGFVAIACFVGGLLAVARAYVDGSFSPGGIVAIIFAATWVLATVIQVAAHDGRDPKRGRRL